MSEEKVMIATKRKSIQQLLDYCLDNRILFTINPNGIVADEFEAVLSIYGIKEGIALGMFLKEHKFEVSGMGEQTKPKATATTVAKSETKENKRAAETIKVEQQSTTAPVLNF
jgi:hypothetical protein